MGLVADKFRIDECRIEQGVFFGNDEVILLVDAEGCFEAGERLPVVALVDADPQGWCSLDRNSSCQLLEPSLMVVGGGTSWEGEGWLAAIEAAGERLVWLLHLGSSEVFRSVRRVGGDLVAVSEEYPTRSKWRIPLRSPEQATFVRVDLVTPRP